MGIRRRKCEPNDLGIPNNLGLANDLGIADHLGIANDLGITDYLGIPGGSGGEFESERHSDNLGLRRFGFRYGQQFHSPLEGSVSNGRVSGVRGRGIRGSIRRGCDDRPSA